MHETMLTVSYESLGKVLEQIQSSAEVKNSVELAGQVGQAVSFHQQMAAEIQALKEEQRLLRQKLSDATREPEERVCSESALNQFVKYEEMKSKGATAHEVYFAIRKDGLSQIESLLALRQVFNLRLQDAQNVLAQAETQFYKQAA